MNELYSEMLSDLSIYEKDTLMNEVSSHSDSTQLKFSWCVKILGQLAVLNTHDNVYVYSFNNTFDTFKQIFIVFKLPCEKLKENYLGVLLRSVIIDFGNSSFKHSFLFNDFLGMVPIFENGYLMIQLNWFNCKEDGFPLYMCRESNISIVVDYNPNLGDIVVDTSPGTIPPPRIIVNYKKKTERELCSIRCKYKFYKFPLENVFNVENGKVHILLEISFPVELLLISGNVRRIKFMKGLRTIYDEDASFYRNLSQICAFNHIVNKDFLVISMNDFSLTEDIESSITFRSMYSLDIEATSSSISVVQLRTCKFQFKNDKVSLVNPF